ncbi:MAG: TRAP transporter large permease [Deltaproteobacteria bacterium]|nr:TRAP transporter large permease [Deltaproteobacteria bacterium]
MSPVLIGILGFVVLFALLTLGMPIGFGMGVVGFLGMCALFPLSAAFIKMATVPFDILSNYSLAVLPMFLLMANIILVSGFGSDLFRVAAKWLGHYRGGLAMATIIAAAGFAACTGSAIATSATMTLVALPEMRGRGYEARFSTGAVCAGGTIGGLLPPSAVFIMYGILTENSIGTLFVAALVPALLTTLSYLATIYLQCLRNPELGPPLEKAPFVERLASLKDCWEILLLALLVFGGMVLGWFSATEAGAVGAVGAVALSLARSRLSPSKLAEAFRNTVRTTGLIYGILIGAFLFNYFCAKSTIPQAVGDWAGGLAVPPWVILCVITVIYLVMGALMDEPSIQVLTIPIFYPLVVNVLGYDPVWFGVIQARLLEIGLIAPPVGMVCFVVAGIDKSLSLPGVYKGVMPFIYMELVTMPLFLFFPQLALWLPGVMTRM